MLHPNHTAISILIVLTSAAVAFAGGGQRDDFVGYVRVDAGSDRVTMAGSVDDAVKARALVDKMKVKDLLLLRAKGRLYVVSDPEVIARFDRVMQPMEAVTRKSNAELRTLFAEALKNGKAVPAPKL